MRAVFLVREAHAGKEREIINGKARWQRMQRRNAGHSPKPCCPAAANRLPAAARKSTDTRPLACSANLGPLGEPGTAQRTQGRPTSPGSSDEAAPTNLERVGFNKPNRAQAPRRPYPVAAHGARTPWPHTAPVPRGRIRRPYHGTRTPYPHLRLRSTPICVSTFSRAPNRAVSTCRRPNRLGTIRMRPPDGPASARARSAEASHGNRRSPFRPQLHRPR